jgi:hypothetical protein
MILVANSTPMVDFSSTVKLSRVNRDNKLLLPSKTKEKIKINKIWEENPENKEERGEWKWNACETKVCFGSIPDLRQNLPPGQFWTNDQTQKHQLTWRGESREVKRK